MNTLKYRDTLNIYIRLPRWLSSNAMDRKYKVFYFWESCKLMRTCFVLADLSTELSLLIIINSLIVKIENLLFWEGIQVNLFGVPVLVLTIRNSYLLIRTNPSFVYNRGHFQFEFFLLWYHLEPLTSTSHSC